MSQRNQQPAFKQYLFITIAAVLIAGIPLLSINWPQLDLGVAVVIGILLALPFIVLGVRSGAALTPPVDTAMVPSDLPQPPPTTASVAIDNLPLLVVAAVAFYAVIEGIDLNHPIFNRGNVGRLAPAIQLLKKHPKALAPILTFLAVTMVVMFVYRVLRAQRDSLPNQTGDEQQHDGNRQNTDA
jgi:hypothetical protein